MNKTSFIVCESINVNILYDTMLHSAIMLFCDGFLKCENTGIDCTIYLQVNDQMAQEKFDGKLIRVSKNDLFECFLSRSGATYLKNEAIAYIHISPQDLVGSSGRLNNNIIYFLLTEVLTRMLIARGFCAYHASSISRNGKSVLLIGESMSGKTTLSLLLAKKGYNYLGDDRVFIRGEKVYAYPKPLHIAHDIRHLFEEEFEKRNKAGKSFVQFSKYIPKSNDPSSAKLTGTLLISKNEEEKSATEVKNKFGTIYGLNSLFYCDDELQNLLDSIIAIGDLPLFVIKNHRCRLQIEEIDVLLDQLIGNEHSKGDGHN